MIRLYIDIDDDSEAGRYWLACARIRDISPRALLRRIVETVSGDQLIPSVLDDGDAISVRRKGEHPFARRPKKAA